MPAQPGPGETPAVVGVAVLGVELDGQLEVAQGQFRRIGDQIRPAPIGLHGRGRVQLERLGEIFDGAGVLAQLGPSQAAAAIDRLERLARLQVAVKRLDHLLETGPAGTRPPHAVAARANGPSRNARAASNERKRLGVLAATQATAARARCGRRPGRGCSRSRARSPGRSWPGRGPARCARDGAGPRRR